MKSNIFTAFKFFTLYLYNRHIHRNIKKIKTFFYNLLYNNNFNNNIITSVEIIDINLMTNTSIYKRNFLLSYIVDVFAAFTGVYNKYNLQNIRLTKTHQFLNVVYLNGTKQVIYDLNTSFLLKDFKFVYIDYPVKIDVTLFFKKHKMIVYHNKLCADKVPKLLYITGYIDKKTYEKFYNYVTRLILLDDSFNEIKVSGKNTIFYLEPN